MIDTNLLQEWQINRSLPTPLCKQLAMNIRWSISTGKLVSGMVLPPVRDLARHLSLSVHTVRSAYKILEEEALVVARPKRGTEVIGSPNAGNDVLAPPVGGQVEDVLFRAVLRAVSSGYTIQELRTVFEKVLDRAVLNPRSCVAFVECTAFDAEKLADQLSRELDVLVEPVVLDHLQSWLNLEVGVSKAPKAIATTFFHYATVLREVQKYNIPVFGVVVESDPQTIEQVSTMPPASRLGVVCRREDSTQYLLNRVNDIVRNGAQVRTAHLHETEELRNLLAWGDAFFVTQPCKATVEKLAPGANIFLFYDRINDQSVAMLRQYVEGLCPHTQLQANENPTPSTQD
ncbi:MAG: GntR family transcriptional regulator [Firmicutes bacterium]|nr:GntR family transcriptional regulator [Bacillota bacterium]